MMASYDAARKMAWRHVTIERPSRRRLRAAAASRGGEPRLRHLEAAARRDAAAAVRSFLRRWSETRPFSDPSGFCGTLIG